MSVHIFLILYLTLCIVSSFEKDTWLYFVIKFNDMKFRLRFGLSEFLMTPVNNPHDAAEVSYNTAHTRTRVIIEKCFGVTKQRFRCLHKSGGALTYAPGKCCKIIIACFILHNMCIQANIPIIDDDEDDAEDEGESEEDSDHEDRDGGAIIRANLGGRDGRGGGWQARQDLINNRFRP